MIFKTFKKGGVHPKESKITAETPAIKAPLPQKAVFPLAQHIGAPAVAVVKKGDKVKVGTVIAQSGGFVSAPIHSSVSGTVLKISDEITASGYHHPAITINVEGDEWEENIDRSDKIERLENHKDLSPEEIKTRIQNAGITGMGGASFPTHVKLAPPKDAKAECVILNGAECEPFITADHRLMLEHAEEIIIGLQLLMKASGVEKGYIGIENNKQDAIDLLTEKAKNNANIEIVALKVKYPQGGEKQLIDAVMKREVPAPPAIPIAVGAIVQNVATAFAVYEAVMKNKPLVERYTTVSGNKITEPKNLIVRLGTTTDFLLNICGMLPENEDNKILNGGPMMGKALLNTSVPITKGTNAITVLSGKEAHRGEIRPCIRCAKCVNVCPMGLEPYLLAKCSCAKLWEFVDKNDITICIECGSCQFACPSNRPLLDLIRLGKSTVMAMKRKKQ